MGFTRDKIMLSTALKKLLVTITIIFTLVLSSTQAEIYIHQLKSQPAEKLIPVIQPHLSKNTKLSAVEFKLIVSGSEQDNNKVTRLLQNLDADFKEYLVKLRITSVPIDTTTSSTQVTLQGDSHSAQQQVTSKQYRTDSLLADDNEFVVRLIENYQGYINTGETYPEVKLVSQYGQLIPKTGRKKIQSGVYISVNQANQQQVYVKASAYQQQRQRGDVQNTNTSSTATRIKASLGQWTLLASTEKLSTAQKRNQYSTKNKSNSSRYYYVKVQPAG
jgi:hypothetical protein